MSTIIDEDIAYILQSDVQWERFCNCTVMIVGATSMLGSYMVYTLAELQRRHPEYNLKIILGVRNIKKAQCLFKDILGSRDMQLWHVDMGEIFEYKGHVDYIIHAASLASSHFFLSHPVQVALPNFLGTWRLLELARREQVKGFLFFSSGAVYGKIENKAVLTEEVDGILLPMDVRSCYGESKRMGENLCACYARQYGVPATSVRISHTYGPTMDLNDSRVFSEFVRNIINDEDIIMKSDGSAKRPFCYISDATVAFFLILLSGKKGEAYNMCNNAGYCSIAELAELLCSLFPEKNLKVIRKARDPNDSYTEDKSVTSIRTDCSKLYALGWMPTIGLNNGFRRTINYFLKS